MVIGILIATLNSCGKFSPLRYEDSDANGGSCRAWAIDKSTNEKVYGAWVSMEMAKAEGWIDKNGSKWKTMPELMRRYRAASFFTKQFAPEVSMGLQTVEEIYDITPIQPTREEKSKETIEQERLKLLISDCKTTDELAALQEANPNADITLFTAKKTNFQTYDTIQSIIIWLSNGRTKEQVRKSYLKLPKLTL